MALQPDHVIAPKPKGPRCRTCAAEDMMTPEERETLRGWLEHPVLSAAQIATWMVEGGYEFVSGPSVERHRRGYCHEARRVAG
jgi:hypothetical protein